MDKFILTTEGIADSIELHTVTAQVPKFPKLMSSEDCLLDLVRHVNLRDCENKVLYYEQIKYDLDLLTYIKNELLRNADLILTPEAQIKYKDLLRKLVLEHGNN